MRLGRFFVFLLITVFLAVFLLPLIGRQCISPQVLLFCPNESNATDLVARDARIFWEMRFPRTILAMLTGSGLAISGLVFQALFRNPLATPYTLGVASGASFGATLFVLYLPFFPFTLLNQSGCAMLGAFLAIGIVYLLARAKDTSSERMLLAGVAVNFFFASLILFLQYIADPAQTYRMLRFTMGGFEGSSLEFWPMFRLAAIILGSSLFVLFLSRELNIIMTGNDRAIALGIDMQRLRSILFLLTSLLVGSIVAIAGPIGFVGLMVPHLCRLIVGPDHRRLIPVTILFGALFLAVCDTIAKSILTVGVLPVGIITSLLGGPFFLWLLLRNK